MADNRHMVRVWLKPSPFPGEERVRAVTVKEKGLMFAVAQEKAGRICERGYCVAGFVGDGPEIETGGEDDVDYVETYFPPGSIDRIEVYPMSKRCLEMNGLGEEDASDGKA